MKNFWFYILAWVELYHEIIINILIQDVLFRITEIANDIFLNKVKIYAKMNIFNCKYIVRDLHYKCGYWTLFPITVKAETVLFMI